MLTRPSYKDYLNQTLQTPEIPPMYPKSPTADYRPPLPHHLKRPILPETVNNAESLITQAITNNFKDMLFLRETYGSRRQNPLKKNSSQKRLSVNKSDFSPKNRERTKETNSFYIQRSPLNLLDSPVDSQPLKKNSSKNSFTQLKNILEKRSKSRSKLNLLTPYGSPSSAKASNDEQPRTATFLQTEIELGKAERKYSNNLLDPKNLASSNVEKYQSNTPKKYSGQILNDNSLLAPIQFRAKKSSFVNQKRESIQKLRSKSPLKSSASQSSVDYSKQSLSVNDFLLGKKLGEGRFGHVFMAIHKQTKAIFALKRVPKSTIRQSLMKDQFALEARLQAGFYHPNIVSLYAVFDDKDYVYLLMEYLAAGSLYNQLKRKGKLEEKQAAVRVYNLCRAVETLHLRGVAHRDIKPENIMMCENQCKLGDFGWATFCDTRRMTYCGTTDYVSPQIVQGVEYGEGVDMWCVGVLTFQLLSGRPPFYHMSRQETFKRIEEATPSYPAYFSPEAVDFISKLLKKVPEQRMSAVDALLHPFILKAASQK